MTATPTSTVNTTVGNDVIDSSKAVISHPEKDRVSSGMKARASVGPGGGSTTVRRLPQREEALSSSGVSDFMRGTVYFVEHQAHQATMVEVVARLLSFEPSRF